MKVSRHIRVYILPRHYVLGPQIALIGQRFVSLLSRTVDEIFTAASIVSIF